MKIIKANYSEARPNTAKLFEMLEDGLASYKSVCLDLMDYLSDDDIKDFMDLNGYND